MTADLLRRAAALMRERAEFCEEEWPAPWDADPALQEVTSRGYMLADLYAREQYMKPLAEHIASWHPDVAVAVADWLDAEAALWEAAADLPDVPPLTVRVKLSTLDKAETFARTYLRETDPTEAVTP